MSVRGIRVKPMRAVKIDEQAASCRKALARAADDERVDVLDVLEEFDGKVIPLPGGGTAVVKQAIEDNLPSHVMARTMLLRKEERIIVALSDGTHQDLRDQGYARFTVPHEIAHVKLHLDELSMLSTLPHHERALARSNPTHAFYEDSEYQADRFAAAFLAPDAGLRLLQRRGLLNVDEVMKVFGMARTPARIRIENFLRAEHERNRRGKRTRGGR